MRVGLDADEVVNEFCRLFPEWGDRRAERVIREKAQIIAHDLDWEDLPAPQQRRASDRAAAPRPGSSGAIACASSPSPSTRRSMLGLGFAGVLLGLRLLALSRRSPPCRTRASATLLLGRSFGLVASEWILRTLQSMPATRRLLSSRTENA